MTVCLKAALVTHTWTWVTHLAIWGSIIAWFIFLIIYRYEINFVVLWMQTNVAFVAFQQFLATDSGGGRDGWPGPHGFLISSFLAWLSPHPIYSTTAWRFFENVSLVLKLVK